ncbi:hypothetical protein Glove_219g165 [Diversispora epigaea]|uniref:Uncharacterized protein n=1 Tax=Diversispora epigaea TaxID=1348612 RepID=A0A397IPA0_9GLOM|nr:hypothetical protein Glove_219g165 [Diversispora epigaea]
MILNVLIHSLIPFISKESSTSLLNLLETQTSKSNTINEIPVEVPSLFSYTVKIFCPIPSFDFVTTNNNNKKNNNNNVKKVKFSNFIKTSDAVDEYDWVGQLGQKEENFEKLAKTKFNMGKWVNKNIYNHQEVLIPIDCYLIAPELLNDDEEYIKAAYEIITGFPPYPDIPHY